MVGLPETNTNQFFQENEKVKQINHEFMNCALKPLSAFKNGIYCYYYWSPIMYQALFNEKQDKVSSLRISHF